MSPDKKAKELVDKLCVKITPDAVHANDMSFYKSRAKQCSLIAVNEIIEAVEAFAYTGAAYDDFETGKMTHTDKKAPTEYWREVKQHIENL